MVATFFSHFNHSVFTVYEICTCIKLDYIHHIKCLHVEKMRTTYKELQIQPKMTKLYKRKASKR